MRRIRRVRIYIFRGCDEAELILRGQIEPLFGINEPLRAVRQNRVHGRVLVGPEQVVNIISRDVALPHAHAFAIQVDLEEPVLIAVYSQHVISQMSGAMNLGHHAMLKFPDRPGSGIISTSRFVYGQVYPEPMENPADRGYSIPKPAAPIASLRRVPTITGESADLTRFPARQGFEDIVQLVSDPDVDVAWTAVTFPRHRYVWFALKDPKVLSSTIFWLSNGGRHYSPWNGRHLGVMGLEEVTSYFHQGLSASARSNPFSRSGYRTRHTLDARRALMVNYIMAVAKIPSGFRRVRSIKLDDDKVCLVSDRGHRVTAPIAISML